MDSQFRFERKWSQEEGKETGGVMTSEFNLMISKLLIACGQPELIDWSNQQFPVETWSDVLYRPGFPHEKVVNDMMPWASFMNIGIEQMLKYQNTMTSP